MESSDPQRVVLTVGHSTHTMERLSELLREHVVTAVADVRATPYSRFNPQFNQNELAGRLRKDGIAYVFLGRELGGRSDDPHDYENGRIRYDKLQAKPAFKEGIERVMRGMRRYRIALLCAEKEPLDCHRTLLVARTLTGQGLCVEHILSDGSLETHDRAMERLIEIIGARQAGLDFTTSEETADSRSDLASQAVAIRAAQVAHRMTT